MRMRLPQKVGLATKFNALIVASILATTLGLGALIVREQIAADVQRLQSDGAALAAMVSQNSEYYNRLLKKLNDQETQIEKLRDEIEQLQKKRDSQRQELENYLSKLNVG